MAACNHRLLCTANISRHGCSQAADLSRNYNALLVRNLVIAAKVTFACRAEVLP